MQLSCSPSEIETLLSQINEKREEYNRAIKSGQEFKYVQAIYLEIKLLEKRYSYAIATQSTSATGLAPLQ